MYLSGSRSLETSSVGGSAPVPSNLEDDPISEVKGPIDGLSRIGLSHAALKAAILAELDQKDLGDSAAAIAEAVAEAIEANNEEILRQLRHRLSSGS